MNVPPIVLWLKAGNGPLTVLEPALLAVPGNQPGKLLTEMAADLHQVANHHPALLTRQPPIPEFEPFSLNPTVAGILVVDAGKDHHLHAWQEIFKLTEGR